MCHSYYCRMKVTASFKTNLHMRTKGILCLVTDNRCKATETHFCRANLTKHSHYNKKLGQF